MTTQTLAHLFLSALFTTVKSGNNLCPPAELTNKSGICPHKGILFGNKKDEVLTQATTWTSLENTIWEVMSVRPKVILRHPCTYNMPSTTPHTRREKGSKPPGADPLAECQKKKRLNTCCSKCDPKTRSTATQKFVRNLSLLDSKAQHSPAL